MNKWKIVCALLSIMILYFTFFLLNNEDAFKNNQRDKQIMEGYLSHYFLLNSEIMGVKINDLECETEKSNLSLSNLVKDKPILIYRYSDTSCQPCIDEHLILLKKNFKESDPIIILGSFQSRKYYLIIKKNKVRDFVLYSIPINSLNIDIDQYGLPYCFILHPNMKISNVFIPDQNNPEYTRQYFEAVKRFLDDQEEENN